MLDASVVLFCNIRGPEFSKFINVDVLTSLAASDTHRIFILLFSKRYA